MSAMSASRRRVCCMTKYIVCDCIDYPTDLLSKQISRDWGGANTTDRFLTLTIKDRLTQSRDFVIGFLVVKIQTDLEPEAPNQKSMAPSLAPHLKQR
jgi:hypothetical protein